MQCSHEHVCICYQGKECSEQLAFVVTLAVLSMAPVHSQCGAAISTVLLWNILILPNCNAVPLKQPHPASSQACQAPSYLSSLLEHASCLVEEDRTAAAICVWLFHLAKDIFRIAHVM